MHRERMVGRPQKSAREQQFQEILQRHKIRIELEARCLNGFAEAFSGNKDLLPFSDSQCRELFFQHNQHHLYDFLHEQYCLKSPTLNQQELRDYSSNRDILYILAQTRQHFLK